MTNPEAIRDLIREYFDYLNTTFGFVEVVDITTNNIYSEVKYKKNDWTLSIVTTAHGSKISLSIISPTGDFGFLHYYFDKLDSQYKMSDKTSQLVENIKFNSNFLKLYGKDVLEGDNGKLNEILNLIIVEHKKWTMPLSRRSDDL